ncbi:MAG: dihydrofolate reductase [Ignavibacteriales bacterium]|nr:dihydrofolate reductase [Ignavibacteriales bacterium]
MQKLRVESFTISVDGFGAGPQQSLENPLGIGGTNLHKWFVPTKTFENNVMGKEEGTTGIDNDFAKRGFNNIGAWILGRNMFSPMRGNWSDENWKGWWGDNPPYHVPVFVLTNYPRKSLEMDGGTIFHFVTDGIHSALKKAFESANGKDVRIGGGVNIIQQYLKEKLIDEMHIAISPILLGAGENLFSGINIIDLGYYCAENISTENATHLIIRK